MWKSIAKSDWHIKAGLFAAICLAIIKFVLSPFGEWQDRTIQEIKVLQKAVAVKKALLNNKSRLKAALQKAESCFEETSKLYYHDFSDAQALQLILQKEMERLAVSCKVKIKSSNWLYPSENYVVQAPVKIQCEAEPEQIIKFLYAIESSRYFFSVDRLKTVSRVKASTLIAELDVSAYGIKEPG